MKAREREREREIYIEESVVKRMRKADERERESNVENGKFSHHRE
jgi:hypothetical protein